MKYIFALILLMSTSTIIAKENLTIADGLTEEQKADLMLQAAQMQSANDAIPEITVPVVSEVKEWAEVINVMGDGLVNIAAKTGMAVNDFSDSKVGIFTMVVIGWNYLGHDFTKFIFGMFWLTIMLPGWLYCYRRVIMIKSVTYFDKKESGGKTKEIEYSGGDDATDATVAMYWVTLALISFVGILAVVT